MRFAITTVHGTFASRSRWPEEDSPLGRYLREQLPGSVEIRPFRWSGRNGFRERERAAHVLREQLLQAMNEDPSVLHFVVSHSHGGNVALLAAGDPVLQRRLAGIICLSTPFLQAWPRPLGQARIMSAGAGVIITLANLLFFVLRKRLDTNVALVIVVALFGFVNWATMKLALRLADPSRFTWKLPNLDTPLLIVRAAGDEASALLGVV